MMTFCAVLKDEAKVMRPILNLARDMGMLMCLAVQKSEDGTMQIAQEYTGNILVHPSQSPEESKDAIMETVTTDWTFWLDADEYPSLALINFVKDFNPSYFHHDSIKFPRLNYIDGYHIEANQGKDEQYRVMRSSVRWMPKEQGRRIHIFPLVQNPMSLPYPIYHYRSLEKIRRQTERWNSLEPQTADACTKYLKDVEEALWKK